ncbi:uncharacterized protein LOC100117202 isoform X2 [Nasonia vitripennis]|uniref:E3 ubiquitin-protein ligase APD1-4 middle domain-containing protein n=1 Tax=Nasonia vitripennis TaxID=7425 RepID=A0A7M7Q0I9_NASVI|nr:uncharacterized protein LOC100117202 isoform X2 [Nasonia vitripennis]
MGIEKMHGIRRVVTFCILTTVLPTMLLVVPLYLRHSVYADVQFAVTESDIVEITDGISPIFCSEHSLKMNDTFNAFQVSRRPEKTSYRKHIRLKKSMTLPDDTLEYWGFYLLKGAKVALTVCSRFEGSSILVVKGERNLRTCGMLDHNKNKAKATGIYLPEADQQVKVTFESNAQEINSKEFVSPDVNKESQKIDGFNNDEQLSKVKQNQTSQAPRTKSNNTENSNQSTATENVESMLDEDEELEALFNKAEGYVNKRINHKLDEKNSSSTDKARHLKRRMTKLHRFENEQNKENDDNVKIDDSHIKSIVHQRNQRKNLENQRKLSERQKERLKLLEEELGWNHENTEKEDNHGEENTEGMLVRQRRSQQPIKPELLDRGIRHGGNAAQNFTDSDESVSSFENGLLNCYEGNVLLRTEFNPSSECRDVNYLLNGEKHMQTIHEVAQDGYYYYIFYSDNDIVSNDIHAVFEIYKPSLQYENVTKACINKTECSFPLSMTSIDRVIVEVPTKDGIDHEMDDISVLVSVCVPRMGIYVIFPIAVLFLILGCAFM